MNRPSCVSRAPVQVYERERPPKISERELEECETMVRDLNMFLRRIDSKSDFMRNAYLAELLQKVRPRSSAGLTDYLTGWRHTKRHPCSPIC
jgi:hypothetical protein